MKKLFWFARFRVPLPARGTICALVSGEYGLTFCSFGICSLTIAFVTAMQPASTIEPKRFESNTLPSRFSTAALIRSHSQFSRMSVNWQEFLCYHTLNSLSVSAWHLCARAYAYHSLAHHVSAPTWNKEKLSRLGLDFNDNSIIIG